MMDDDFSERRRRRERDDRRAPGGASAPGEELLEEVNPNEGLPFARRWRMAVFGGSFDPVHLGHVRLARQVLEHDLADEVLFVPARRSPFKGVDMMDTGAARLEMLQLALAESLEEKESYVVSYPDGRQQERKYRLGVSDVELRRGGQYSYTYDTLTMLARIYPDVEIRFLMGTDCLRDLQNWHNAGGLLKNFEFLVYPRAGVQPMGPVEVVRTFRSLAPKLVKGMLSEEDFPTWELSSTEIRERIAGGEDLSEALPKSVWNYIQEHGLYKKQ